MEIEAVKVSFKIGTMFKTCTQREFFLLRPSHSLAPRFASTRGICQIIRATHQVGNADATDAMGELEGASVGQDS